MTNGLEQRIHDAGNWPVPALDTTALAGRARQRQRRRRGFTAVAAVTTIALVVGVAAAVWPDSTHRTVVTTTGRAPAVTWTPVTLPEGAGGYGARVVAGGPEGLIAIGNVGPRPEAPTDPPPVATIWRSSDAGANWTVAYSDANQVRDASGSIARPAASFQDAYYVNGMFVVTGTVNQQGTDQQIAGMWTSPDGTAWTKSNNVVFQAPSVKRNGGGGRTNTESRILSVTGWDGRIVAIGDLYIGAPKSKQCCGLGVATWTSADGRTWKRRIADLGDGFDPYIKSLTAAGPNLAGGGTVDVWTGTVWTTRDLRTWDRSAFAHDARGTLLRFGRGYIIAGGQYTGPKATRKNPVEFGKSTGIPTIWWSRDTHNWEPAYTLAERSDKDVNTPNVPPAFTSAAAVPHLALTTGPALPRHSGSPVYASTNGQKWARLAVPGETPNARAAIVGTDTTGIYVSRYLQTSPNRTSSPATVWHVTPDRSEATFDLTVTALPTLKFDATSYTVPAGNVRLTFTSEGGTHSLQFDTSSSDPMSKRVRRVHLKASGGQSDTTTVRLEPGTYTIHCVRGHRDAGEEATIVVE